MIDLFRFPDWIWIIAKSPTEVKPSPQSFATSSHQIATPDVNIQHKQIAARGWKAVTELPFPSAKPLPKVAIMIIAMNKGAVNKKMQNFIFRVISS
jgi:hypothetical protein